jgi:ribosomal protein S18 acetylase RimI-like enzyme
MDWALEVAENANTYTPLGPRDERIVTDRYVLWLAPYDKPWANVAQRLRLEADEIDEVRAEIHATLRDHGRTVCTWEVGTHATPVDLADRLRGLGLVDQEYVVGMVLTEEPPHAPPEFEVRPAVTDDERLAAARIAAIAFGADELPAEPPAPSADPDNITYLAFLDGRPVARASGSYGEHAATLFGGATLPDARGRGAYRALVAARWREAVARGTPLLVTQAGPMSRPILAQLGFREVCELWILLDVVG